MPFTPFHFGPHGGETTTYYYDAFNRIKQIVDPDGGKTLFTHDKSGKRLSLQFANGVTGAYFYDPANRLQSIVYKNTIGDVLQSFTYLNDKVGNRIAKTFATGESESYGYDDLHRLASVSYPTGRSVSYQYDPVGNRQYVTEAFSSGGSDTTSYTYSDFNQVLSTTNSQGTSSYAWDDNGNLIGKQTPAGEITQYSYSFENRLISILYANGSTNAFGYDPQGIRVFKEDSQGRTNYLIEQVSVLAEYTGLGSKKAWYNSNPQRIDEILSQVQAAGKFYHLVDGLGSVTGLVNQAQAKVAAYTYDAYGALTDQQVQPGIQNPYLFTGRELDQDSGLQYNRARYYLNGVGSWNSEDPIETTDYLNRYLYAFSNPISFHDPDGYYAIPLYIDSVSAFVLRAFVIMATAIAASNWILYYDIRDILKELAKLIPQPKFMLPPPPPAGQCDPKCEEIAKGAFTSAQNLIKHIIPEFHFHKKACQNVFVFLQEAIGRGCNLFDPRFIWAALAYNSICTDPRIKQWEPRDPGLPYPVIKIP